MSQEGAQHVLYWLDRDLFRLTVSADGLELTAEAAGNDPAGRWRPCTAEEKAAVLKEAFLVEFQRRSPSEVQIAKTVKLHEEGLLNCIELVGQLREAGVTECLLGLVQELHGEAVARVRLAKDVMRT